ncbi:MAG TPA: D-arabinono-1,4-lactone oxidase [Streptosporangiaceae bacterium]|nr:D-arabinono-1,4-lactone oxidase [Streptosporangiaceae bacterium]
MAGRAVSPGRRANWAGNVVFGAAQFRRPATVAQLQAIVARARHVRVLGTGHSFNDIADSPGLQVSLAGLPPEVEVDSAAPAVRVAAGLSYARLAPRLDAAGFGLRAMASLPHISVAGACATATHGSGAANQNLAAAVTAMEMVAASGDLVTLRRGDDGFDGAVVHLGALGAVVSLTLQAVPSFDVAQRVYEDLPLAAVEDHFAEIMSAGHSVSLFTDWRGPRLTQIWVKQRLPGPGPGGGTARAAAGPAPPAAATWPESASSAALTPPVTQAPWFTARPAAAPRHPVPGMPPDATTGQGGVPGRWYSRLPHFRPGFTPSAGAELQSEYLLPVEHAVPALRAVSEIRDRVAPALQVCEVRVVAADGLWLSPSYRADTVAIHFTWKPDAAAVLPVLGLLERCLAPFAARPHWGKLFTTPPQTVRSRYQRLPDFLDLMRRYDPAAKFGNAYTARYLAA